MVLTRKLFTEIVGVDAESIAIFEPAGSRRKHIRVAFGSRARIYPLIEAPGQVGCPVLVRDISRCGIGFLFDEPMALGDEFVIHLPRIDREPVHIHSIVQRCVPGGSGGTQWAIGATFELVMNSTDPIELPSEEDLAEASEAVTKDENKQTEVEDRFDQIMKGPPAPVIVRETQLRRLVKWLCRFSVIGKPVAAAIKAARFVHWLATPAIYVTTRIARVLHLDQIASPRIHHRLRKSKLPKRQTTDLTKLARVESAPKPISPSHKPIITPATPSFVPTSSPMTLTVTPFHRSANSKLFAAEEAETVAATVVVAPVAVEVKPAAAIQVAEAPAALQEVVVEKLTETPAPIVAEPVVETPRLPALPEPHVVEIREAIKMPMEDLPMHVASGSYLLDTARPHTRGFTTRHPRRRPKNYFRLSIGTKSVMVGPV